MIKFNKQITLQIIETFDEKNDIVESIEETFSAGEKADADIYSETKDYADIQFGDGSVAMHVSKKDFEVIEPIVKINA